jgi:hypothetical protein
VFESLLVLSSLWESLLAGCCRDVQLSISSIKSILRLPAIRSCRKSPGSSLLLFLLVRHGRKKINQITLADLLVLEFRLQQVSGRCGIVDREPTIIGPFADLSGEKPKLPKVDEL